MLLAVAKGRSTDEALHYRKSSLPDPFHVPWPADYVWDCHTWRGMERISAASPPLGFGLPIPAGLDLRWSGAEAGTLWRYLAWKEHGTCEIPWNEIGPVTTFEPPTPSWSREIGWTGRGFRRRLFTPVS